MESIRWGVLGTAKIAIQKVIPAMQAGTYTTVTAISSRDKQKAREAAEGLGIPKHYGSYDDLLDDPEIDAIYIPLPNHLHVPWTIKALEAGKHVLCEKPIALDADEAEELLEASRNYPELKVMEAFMYRFHPQWVKAKELVQSQQIGELQAVEVFFSYYNTDPNNIRNKANMGGGALMDIGCYGVNASRFLFEQEAGDIQARMKKDPKLKIDHLSSAILEFGDKLATFTCSTQMEAHQQINIHGTQGRISMPLPFNPPPDKSVRITLHNDSELEAMEFHASNHYTIQGDLFSKAILENSEVPLPLEDSHANMKVIDAIRRSAISREHHEAL